MTSDEVTEQVWLGEPYVIATHVFAGATHVTWAPAQSQPSVALQVAPTVLGGVVQIPALEQPSSVWQYRFELHDCSAARGNWHVPSPMHQ